MSDLTELREKIDSIDIELLRLFEKRMLIVGEVAEYKIDNHLAIRDGLREQKILEKIDTLVSCPELAPYCSQFQRKLIELSCEYQQELINSHTLR